MKSSANPTRNRIAAQLACYNSSVPKGCRLGGGRMRPEERPVAAGGAAKRWIRGQWGLTGGSGGDEASFAVARLPHKAASARAPSEVAMTL